MRLLGMLAMLLAAMATLDASARPDEKKDKAASMAALQALQEFIGPWKGDGEVKDGKPETWKEGMGWAWKLKGDQPSLAVEFEKGKFFTKGDLKYLPEKKLYEFKVTDNAKNDLVFEGEFKRKVLTLSRTDDATKDKQILAMSTNNDGVRFIYNYSVQAKGKGIEKKVYTVQHTKEGASLAATKKNECCVTGGLGTIPVSYNGKTYYVCCSGCRDAFNDDPKGIVAAYEKKKK